MALVNQHRASMGLVALTVNATLTDAAVWKSRHMAAYGYFAHDDPAPPVARSRSRACSTAGTPRGGSLGENIAAGQQTPSAVMTAWLNSPGHRANIEAPSFRSIGVGVAVGGPYGIYWTQDFASGTGSRPPPPSPPPPPPAPPAPPAAASAPGLAAASAAGTAAAAGTAQAAAAAGLAAGPDRGSAGPGPAPAAQPPRRRSPRRSAPPSPHRRGDREGREEGRAQGQGHDA